MFVWVFMIKFVIGVVCIFVGMMVIDYVNIYKNSLIRVCFIGCFVMMFVLFCFMYYFWVFNYWLYFSMELFV